MNTASKTDDCMIYNVDHAPWHMEYNHTHIQSISVVLTLKTSCLLQLSPSSYWTSSNIQNIMQLHIVVYITLNPLLSRHLYYGMPIYQAQVSHSICQF